MPASCLLCGADSHHQPLCAACHAQLPWLPSPRCPACALPSPDQDLCGRCLRHRPAFDATIAAFAYAGALAQLIPAAKFGGHWSLLSALSDSLLPELATATRPDHLIPLPLHPARLQERGFNQAMEMARIVHGQLKIPLQVDWLQRIQDTAHQARLSEEERQKNMRGAFVASPQVAGKHIALIDDVMTTGASLNAAAKALKAAGARRVDAWVLARTL